MNPSLIFDQLVDTQSATIGDDQLLRWFRQTMDVLPDPAAVLDRGRHVLMINPALADFIGERSTTPILGARFGEALGCLFSTQGISGCGSSLHCASCTARRLIANELEGHQSIFKFVPRDSNQPTAEFDIRMTSLTANDREYLLCTLRARQTPDLRSSQERMFLHQIYSTASALVNTSQMLLECTPGDCSEEEEHELKQIMEEGAQQIVNEIKERRQLLEFEHGEIDLNFEEISINDLLRGLGVSGPPNLEISPLETDGSGANDQTFVSDPVLLHRTLQRIIKEVACMNPGEALRLFVKSQAQQISFLLHFPMPLNRHLQHLLMHGMESGNGSLRGMNMQDVLERGLQGKLEYMIREPLGTIVIVSLPRQQSNQAEVA